MSTAPLPRDANGQVAPFADGTGKAAAPQLDSQGNVPVSLSSPLDSQGNVLVTLGAHTYLEDALFNAMAITDTITHYSTISTTQGWRRKVIVITHTLNQTVTITPRVSRDGVNWQELPNTGALAAGMYLLWGAAAGGNSTWGFSIAGLDAPWPYMDVTAVCTTAPTSGSLSVLLEKEQ